MLKKLAIIFLSLICSLSFSQDFLRKDSLRGYLSEFRSCYDVTFYDLRVLIDEKNNSIYNDSYNDISLIAEEDFLRIQIDLAYDMHISFIEFEGNQVNYSREYDAVFIDFPRKIYKGEKLNIKIWYFGQPRAAVNPPWDGGFSWKKDKNNNPWIGVSCQGLGASSWWPCKDHQSDEPDSMKVSVIVRSPLKAIANGNLRRTEKYFHTDLEDSVNLFEWFVSYPINNYGVSISIGDYVHFTDYHIRDNDTLDLSYYVLAYNKDKAEKHFLQVEPMLQCFEDLFGRYPFWNDGFALIETPYLGMEHQSGIAYGNDYLPGYRGSLSYSGGFEFDYIIIHETGHEWWGNSVTTNDIADMWIHEGFCTYSEALYVECIYGYDEMLGYVNNQKRFIRNNSPIIGFYHVNHQGSSDMYHKASVMLHTLRTLIADDDLWFSIIKEIHEKYKYKTVDAQEIIDYIMLRTEYDLTHFFSQYLNHKEIPEFQYKLVRDGLNTTLVYRWEAIQGFDMPLLINTGKNDFWIYPNLKWKEMNLGIIDREDFFILEKLFLIETKKIK